MGIKVTINEGVVNGQSFSIKLPDQPLIANTAGAAIRITFEGTDWNNYLNGTNSRGIKAVFSAQDIDPIAVYKENTGYWTQVTGLTNVFDIRLPAQTYSAPGFSMNIIGYQIDQNTQDQYSELYSTNSVFVRIYPSGPVSGNFIGLNPAINWADRVPTAINQAEAAYTMVTTLSSVINETYVSVQTTYNSVKNWTLITEVTSTGDNAPKPVMSSGIFNFVEVTTHTNFRVEKTDQAGITPAMQIIANHRPLRVEQTTNHPGSYPNQYGVLMKADTIFMDFSGGSEKVSIDHGKLNANTATITNFAATNISATNTTTTNLMVTSNATIANLLTIPAGARIDATATSVTCINITRSTNVDSDPVLNIEVASTDNHNLLGPAIRLKSDNTYAVGGNTHALLEIETQGGTAAKFHGTVGIDNVLWLDGSSTSESSGDVVFVVKPLTAGQNKLTISKNGDLLYTSAGTISLAERKKNIKLVDSTLDKILNAGIYSYQLKDSSPDHTKYGLVIGEGYNCPEEVMTKNKDGIDIYSMISFAWKGIQELNDKIVSLENRVAELEAQLNNQ